MRRTSSSRSGRTRAAATRSEQGYHCGCAKRSGSSLAAAAVSPCPPLSSDLVGTGVSLGTGWRAARLLEQFQHFLLLALPRQFRCRGGCRRCRVLTLLIPVTYAGTPESAA